MKNCTINCNPRREAVGSENKLVSLTKDTFTQAKRIEKGEDVNMVTIDSFDYDNVNLIKIDVEGYEMEVLKGAEKTLDKTQFVMIELNNNTKKYGNQVQDVIEPNKDDIRNFSHLTNHSGGIEGGMSNGNSIVVNVAIKPIATMTRPLPSVDILSGEVVEASYNRSDICQVSRACPVGEAMLSCVLLDHYLMNKAQCK